MKPLVLETKNRPERTAEYKRPLYIYYSETEFFYEGQELRYRSNERNRNAGIKAAKRDRFFAHYNSFF